MSNEQNQSLDESSTIPSSPSKESLDAVSFADSLASFGCSLREHFIHLFTSAIYKNRGSVDSPLVSGNYEAQGNGSNENKTDENNDTIDNTNNLTNDDNNQQNANNNDNNQQNANNDDNNQQNANNDDDDQQNTNNDSEKKKEIKEMNLTQYIAHFLGNTFNLRERLSSLVELVVPDFSTNDPTLFHSDSNPDLVDFFGTQRGGDKFMDLYSVKDATELIKSTSLASSLEKMGFGDWYIEFDLSDCFVHYAYVRSRSIPDADKFIGFMIVQKGEFRLKSPLTEEKSQGVAFVHSKFPQGCNMLNIRWFSLQNPRATFTSKRPRLPGQRFPGTGLARECFKLFCKQCLKNGRDGIVNVPEHFHNALLYEKFVFLNPEDQGEFEKMKNDLSVDIKEKGLAAVSWAIYLGFLRKGEQVVKWEPHEQIFPLSFKLLQYFHRSGFKKIVEEKKKQKEHYRILWDEAEHYCLTAVIEFSNEENRIPF